MPRVGSLAFVPVLVSATALVHCSVPDEAAESEAENAQSSLAPACEQLNSAEGDVVTHWPGVGGTGAPAFSRGMYGACYLEWGPGYFPTLDQYLTNTYARSSVPQSKAMEVLGSLCEGGGNVPFRMINAVGDFYGRVLQAEGQGYAQIINNVVVEGSLATIILPPYWRRNGTYPIVFQGFYDINENLYLGFGEAQTIAKWIALSGIAGRTGAIGVIWNGGGSITSATTHPHARYQFSKVIDLVALYAGGDRHRIIMLGGSRGGSTALGMASNPEGYNYTVTFLYSGVPGVKYGTHARLIGPTMPAQVPGLSSTGFADAWRSGWTYPAGCGGRPELVGMTARQALAHTILGSADFDWVDRENSPVSDRFVQGLKARGTQVVLNIGTHDEYIPHGTQLEYLNKLRAYGVPVEAHVLVRGGHGDVPGLRESKIQNAILSYVQPGADPALRTVNPITQYYRLNRDTQQLEPFSTPGGRTPVTVEVPRVLLSGMPASFFVNGDADTSVYVSTNIGTFVTRIGAYDPSGQSAGTPQGPNMNLVELSTNGFSGEIVYNAVAILRPGDAQWTYLDLQETTSRDRLRLSTSVLAGPVPDTFSSSDAYLAMRNPYNAGGSYPMVSWGVSEY